MSTKHRLRSKIKDHRGIGEVGGGHLFTLVLIGSKVDLTHGLDPTHVNRAISARKRRGIVPVWSTTDIAPIVALFAEPDILLLHRSDALLLNIQQRHRTKPSGIDEHIAPKALQVPQRLDIGPLKLHPLRLQPLSKPGQKRRRRNDHRLELHPEFGTLGKLRRRHKAEPGDLPLIPYLVRVPLSMISVISTCRMPDSGCRSTMRQSSENEFSCISCSRGVESCTPSQVAPAH